MINNTLFSHCLNILPSLLQFNQATPTESCLAFYFNKQAPRAGAKDRQIIGDVLFTLTRNLQSIHFFLDNQKDNRKKLICAIALYLHQQNPPESIKKNLTSEISSEEITLGNNFLHWWQQKSATTSPRTVTTELPEWLLQKLDFLSEEQIISLSDSLKTPAPLDLRVNLLKAKRDKVLLQLQQEGLPVEATPYSPWGIRCHEKINLSKHPLFLNGTLEIQDEGSQLLALITGAKRNELIVDFCAGSGGKTLALSAMMTNTGRIYAIDNSEHRLKQIKPRLERSGVSNITIQHIAHENDNRLHKLTGKADRVLIDAPCSGLGTLRRHPDLKYRQNPQTIKQITQTQQAILEAAEKLVKPGGTLIYASCSFLPEENQQRIASFLTNHPEYETIQMHTILEKSKINLQMGEYLMLRPDTHNTDGFFAAVLKKNS